MVIAMTVSRIVTFGQGVVVGLVVAAGFTLLYLALRRLPR